MFKRALLTIITLLAAAVLFAQPGLDELVEEEFGSWDMVYNATSVAKGNLFFVDSTVNLYEHRFHLDFNSAQPLCFFVYQGTQLEGTYTLVDSVTHGNQGPGNTFYASGERNFELTSGYFYYVGVCWSGVDTRYARANGPTPPIACSFGRLEWGVGYCYTGFPPAATVTYRVTQYTAYHAIIVTGTPGVSPLLVTLTPHNPPIQIPAGGGPFTYDASVENTTQDPITFDAWVIVMLPNGIPYGPLIQRNGLIIPAGATILRTLNQNVPGMAPPGEYTMVGSAGVYPDSVISTDSFTFNKLAGDGAQSNYNNWTCTGWESEYQSIIENHKSQITNLAASPNPFNCNSTITFTLGQASQVELAVYDPAGRQVALLAEGWMPSGAHSVNFNAQDLPSGVYFARLSAANTVKTEKLLLLK